MDLRVPSVLSTVVTAVAVLALGALVFFQNPRAKPNQLWLLFNLSIAAWAIPQSCYVVIQHAAWADFLVRLSYALGVLWIPTLYLHFVWTHLNRQSRWPLYFAYGFSLACLTQVLNPAFLPPPKPKFSLAFYTEAGPLYYPFVMMWSTIVIYALRELYTEMKRVRGSRRNQLRYLFYSSCIGYVGGASNFLPVFNIDAFPYVPYGNYGIPIYVAMFTYAIVRHHALDMRVVVTQTGVLLATYLVVLGVPFAVGWWGREWLEQAVGPQWWLVPLGLCTVLATVGPFAYAYLRRQAEARLLKEQRHYQRMLQHAARGMTRVRRLDKLTRLIVRVVSRAVHVEHASLFLWEKENRRYALVASHGPKRLAIESWYAMEESHPLIQWLLTHRRVLSADETSTHSEIGEGLNALSASLIVPGLIEREVIGFLALGKKCSGEGYAVDDLHAFATLANEAAIAVENARSYEELAKANEELRTTYDRMVQQERLVAAGQFATGLAHEIKNPLSAIKTFAAYLPEKYRDATFREKFFRIVQSEIDRINAIVRQLSDFAKPSPLNLQPVRVADVIQDTLSLLSSECLKHDVEVRPSFHENGLAIQADPQQLKQVFLNLFLNSLDAMSSGGQLVVETDARDRRLMVRVRDTGSGIPPQLHDRLGHPFFTTKERGMGLGLAIVKGIVDRHGGRLSIRSEEGKGTTVEVSLPIPQRTQN